MNTVPNLAWPSQAVAAVREFHQLEEERERAGLLAADPQTRLTLLLEIFEPMRVCGSGLRREAVRVRMDLDAVVLGPRGRRQDARLVWLSLRELELIPQEPLRLGAAVRVIVEGPSTREWVRFAGRVVELDLGSGAATVLISGVRSWQRDPWDRWVLP